MNLPAKTTGVSLVYANWGRWFADCPCSAGMQFGAPGYPPLLVQGWQCPECGDVNEAIWPDLEMMRGVERLLLLRRYPKNRNWFPGETLLDLMQENDEHGVMADHQMEGGVSLMASETRILEDHLPLASSSRRELGWSKR